ncbi:membrane protein [Microlunatus spumicola]|uniref:Membrane protein n=1 Tax=Microlunatus spumicola TaxID=81499 RepID=A0ABP6WNE2_9ACTN
MTTTTHPSPPVGTTTAVLRRLYLARAGFALVWALLVVLTASGLGPVSVALLLLYPLVDLAAAVVDHRSSRVTRPAPALVVNMALSLLAVVGLAYAVTSGLRTVLLVWGAWAVTTGFVQLVVAVGRRALGGQWPMIVSGGLSVLAGAAFVAQSGTPGASLTGLAGYATLGGVFFLVSALRLRRAPAHDGR